MFTFQNENYLNNIYTVTYYIVSSLRTVDCFICLTIISSLPFQEDNNDTREIESFSRILAYIWREFYSTVCIC